MKLRKNGRKPLLACILPCVLACALLLTGCTPDPFDTYTKAYQKVTANGGFDADLSASVTMEGETVKASGNFKLDTSGGKDLFILEVNVDGEDITQFSDGEYLYTEARGQKTKYELGKKDTQKSSSREDPSPDGGQAAPEFTTSDFLEEFASFLEAGKIRELGLLSPLPSSAVSKTTVNGDTYSMTLPSAALDAYMDVLSSSVDMGDNSVEVKDLKDFTYEATVKDDYVTKVVYKGSMTAVVPAGVSGTGSEETYPMDMVITVEFNNPGSTVSIDLPSTDGY